MISWGDLPLGAVIPFPFTTYGKTNGESITLTGLAVTDIECFKGVSMTQRSSDAGYALMDTDGIDIDGVTGFHGFSIDTGDNTDAGFYVAGSFYTVLVSAVTIDSQTVNFVAGTFRLVAAEATAGVPVTNVTHAAGTAWGSGAITAASIAADAITDAKVASDVTIASVTGAVGSVTGAVGSVASGGITAASFAANAINAAKLDPDVTTELQAGLATAAALAVVDGIVDDILLDTAEIGTAGAGLTSRASQTSVDDLPTNAELATSQAAADDATLAAIAALNNLSAAQVNTEVDTALADIHLDHLLAVTYDPASKPGVADALLNELVESDAGVARYTANALEQAPTGGSAPTVGQIADAVWDEAIADHAGVGSTGEALSDAGGAGTPPTVTEIRQEMDANSTKLADILTDTAEIGAAGAGLTSRASQVSVDDLPTNAELATSQAAADDATLAAIAAQNNLSAAQVRTELTTELGRIDATISSRATPAQVNTEADTALSDVGLTSVVTGRIDAAVSTRATPAQVATELGTYDGPTKAEMDAAVALLATAANLATLDARFTGSRAEPAQGAPAASTTALAKLDFLYKLARNRLTQDATTLKVYADDAVTVDHKATVSDSGTLYDRGELGTGP